MPFPSKYFFCFNQDEPSFENVKETDEDETKH